jgi:LPXTG-site transpeptidase (sortase) family protein
MHVKHVTVTSRTLRLVSGATALAVVAVTLIVFGLQLNAGSDDVTEDPFTISAPPMPLVSLKTNASAKLLPISLKIPSIDVDAPITRLGLNADKTVQVPKNPDDAGWYGKGPAPGYKGSSVILGHVDSKTGPAVFYRLPTLGPGDHVNVKLSDGSLAHYQVTRVAHYKNEDFPAAKVYATPSPRPALNLITCGGEYDKAAGGYQSNVVVFTKYLWATGRKA